MRYRDVPLAPEEAEAVARLHAVRALGSDRDGLAPASPEEIARRIGISPDEVRELAAEVRRQGTDAGLPRIGSTQVRPSRAFRAIRGAGIWMLVGAVVGSLAALNVADSFSPRPLRPKRKSPSAAAPAPSAAAKAANAPKRGVSMPSPFGAFATEPVLASGVTAPPPGYAVFLRTSQRRMFLAGPPATTATVPYGRIATALMASLRSLVQYSEAVDEPPPTRIFLHFPFGPDTRDLLTSFGNFEGFHAVEVRSPRGSTFAWLPDGRYVAPKDTESYRREFAARLDALLDPKAPAVISPRLRRRAAMITLKTPFPKGASLAVFWPGGKIVAEGKGTSFDAGDSIQSALVELLQEAYRQYHSPTWSYRAVMEVPGDAFDCTLLPYEFGMGSPPKEPLFPAGARIGWFNERAHLAYAATPGNASDRR